MGTNYEKGQGKKDIDLRKDATYKTSFINY